MLQSLSRQCCPSAHATAGLYAHYREYKGRFHSISVLHRILYYGPHFQAGVKQKNIYGQTLPDSVRGELQGCLLHFFHFVCSTAPHVEPLVGNHVRHRGLFTAGVD